MKKYIALLWFMLSDSRDTGGHTDKGRGTDGGGR